MPRPSESPWSAPYALKRTISTVSLVARAAAASVAGGLLSGYAVVKMGRMGEIEKEVLLARLVEVAVAFQDGFADGFAEGAREASASRNIH